ncbi:MAG: hypothetical protein E6J21_10690 [Chloroflexota bacterium]|nr:MAG: hypothetical protein E6J21_10690 [Chloroflexota bacterium]
MGKKPLVRVALDLETTGLQAEHDAILEVAAIKFQGATVLDTLETLVAPGRPVPYRVQRLTGITPQQLTGVPQFESIAQKLQQFIDDLPIVGHSIPFDVGFLRRRGLVRNNALIDTFELATVLLPSLPSYNLGQVAAALGIMVAPERHRAMVDTELAMQVFLALHQRLQAVDLALLKDLANLDAPHNWPLLAFFRQELRFRQEKEGLRGVPIRGSLGDRFAAQLGMDPRVLSFAIAHESDAQVNAVQTPQVETTPPALNILEQMKNIVEVIPEQANQAAPLGYRTARKAVLEALMQRTTLLMEVTLGGSDYTPALLPALEWLTGEPFETQPGTSPRRLLIACSNQQSARRLIETVLPRLQASLKSQLPVAYLAEHGGYLCTHRWFGAALRRTSGELTAEQARGLAKQGIWAQQTLTGERSELTMLPQEITAWERISSGVERIPSADGRIASAYDRCVYRRKGYCFVSRAEERVKTAKIVVTTHAGLLDDLTHSHSLLAAIDRRLIVDADLLEEEMSRWSSAELEQTHLLGLLNTIGTELPDGRYQGLLALGAPALRENGPGGLSTTPTVSKSEVDTRMRTWFQTLHHASDAVSNLFSCYGQLLEEFLQHGSGSNNGGRDKGRNSYGGRSNDRTDQPLRLTGETRNLGTWTDVERAWQQTAQRLQHVIDLVHEAERVLLTTQRSHHRLDVGSGEEDSVASELAAIAWKLLEQKRLGQQAMALAESDMVYWLRMPPAPPPFVQQTVQQRLVVPPVPLTTPSGEHSHPPVPVLYGDNNSSFSRARFGLENDACPALSAATEHHEQTLLYPPNDVPEPNMPQYQRSLDETFIQLATALEGQMVILYTSHASLRSSYAAVKPVLEGRGILVLGQGVDGSPRQLWQLFNSQEHVIVLGTGNFWDNIGEISRVPVCTFITRLPMPVLNDPPVAARAEHYSDQLHQLTVPVASLRLRRALNRLVWSEATRNVVILFDRRVLSKEYGSTILHSLPRSSQRQAAVSHMPETILDWLTASGSWE